MATLSVVPARDREASETRRTLADHLSGVDAIIDTVESLDDETLDEAARAELSEMLIAELAGTRRKVDNVSAALATWESLEAGAQREIERLEARRKRFARLRGNLELHVMAVLEASKLTKLEGNFSTLTLRHNPPSVRIDDAALVPAVYLRTPPAPAAVPDKTAIKSALLAGQTVEGCVMTRGQRLVRS